MKCIECTFWKRHGGDYIVKHLEQARPWGTCGRLEQPGALARVDGVRDYDEKPGEIDTHETFGCVHFEAKEPTA